MAKLLRNKNKNSSKTPPNTPYIKATKKRVKKRKIKKERDDREDIKSPSSYSIFQNWRNKELDKWECVDLIGFYLAEYFRVYESEDMRFYKVKDKNHEKLSKIRKPIDNLIILLDGPSGVKDMITTLIGWSKTEDANWLDGRLNYHQIFKSEHFYEKYIEIREEEKSGSKNKTMRQKKEISGVGKNVKNWSEMKNEL